MVVFSGNISFYKSTKSVRVVSPIFDLIQVSQSGSYHNMNDGM